MLNRHTLSILFNKTCSMKVWCLNILYVNIIDLTNLELICILPCSSATLTCAQFRLTISAAVRKLMASEEAECLVTGQR